MKIIRKLGRRPRTYQGSNSWMMLSKRMTANSREEKPDIQASRRMANVIKLLQPAVFRLIKAAADLPLDLAPVLIVCGCWVVFHLGGMGLLAESG